MLLTNSDLPSAADFRHDLIYRPAGLVTWHNRDLNAHIRDFIQPEQGVVSVLSGQGFIDE